MALFLVQHGKTEASDDPERTLSDEGRAEVERIAVEAARHGVRPARILHSGKVRAKDTAKILAQHLSPPDGVGVRKGMDPEDDAVAVLAYLDPSENLMLVSHLPFLEKLAAALVTGSADKLAVKFQNAGIVCLDYERSRRSWFVKWMLVPAFT